MNILVTGGAGFIGSNVVDEFIRLGHRVVVVDNLSTGRRALVNPDAAFVEMDIRDAQIGSVLKDHAIEVICHHAAQIDVRKSVSDPMYDAQVNIMGMLNLLEQARRGDVKKILFASTGGAIYGDQEYFPADEEHPLRPCSPYGIAKLSCEKYLHYYRLTYGLDYVALRYGNVYGPRQNPHGEAGVVAIFAKKLLAREQPVIHGPGGQTRDYVFVQDVVAANVAALTHPVSDQFNIGTGRETTVNELFHRLNKLCGNHAREVHGDAKAGEQQRSVLNCSRAKAALGWEPQFDLEEGLRRTVAYFNKTDSLS